MTETETIPCELVEETYEPIEYWVVRHPVTRKLLLVRHSQQWMGMGFSERPDETKMAIIEKRHGYDLIVKAVTIADLIDELKSDPNDMIAAIYFPEDGSIVDL